MEIRDIGNIPDSSRIDRIHKQDKPAEPDRVQEEKPVQAEPTEQQRDEYISSMVDRVQSASYNVFDVRQGRVDDLRAQIQEGTYNPEGEKIAQKLIDVILSTGRKNLRVYRMKT